ncbi:topoisomerase III [Capsaspora owczarzaki ATCC 30864]|uniref:topoisomerase III n=1 Tax=Capsaspora owczarzaki (strain ATCC 30864) TaxID=595528 RepID=UPI0003524254|nr:topoisomerase III [Capsaspora owczarzaki ATCC 30864]|eukprot:XP_004342668.2 topoisomerase III [Capsaspora owczarzaki ATCC 30864]
MRFCLAATAAAAAAPVAAAACLTVRQTRLPPSRLVSLAASSTCIAASPGTSSAAAAPSRCTSAAVAILAGSASRVSLSCLQAQPLPTGTCQRAAASTLASVARHRLPPASSAVRHSSSLVAGVARVSCSLFAGFLPARHLSSLSPSSPAAFAARRKKYASSSSGRSRSRRSVHIYDKTFLDSDSQEAPPSSSSSSSSNMVRVLNVAEKPSVAKSISEIMFGGRPPSHRDGVPVFTFDTNFRNQPCTMVFTSVVGHLLASDFTADYSKWNTCAPEALFEAPIERFIPEKLRDIEKMLQREAQRAQWLVLWTDCDREGENIASEVVAVCKKVNRNLVVLRARFSAVTPRDITHACNNLTQVDGRQVDAVDARIELDLRIGSAFTRMQTQLLQPAIPELNELKSVISYGPCQFPTLGFIVDRYRRVKAFVPEEFWTIVVACPSPSSESSAAAVAVPQKPGKKGKAASDTVPFTWVRGQLFDHPACLVLYEMILERPEATVVSVESRPTSKWRPLPLSTVELQKLASVQLRFTSDHTLKTAESLYTQGFLSYPRTDTDVFPETMDLTALANMQANHPEWGSFVHQYILARGPNPRKGKNNDEAHPPIHPTKPAPASFQNADEKKLYELVTRSFLATLSSDAQGHLTNVEIDVAGERFRANGLAILERNYLLVYPYDVWSNHTLPPFREGDRFQPAEVRMDAGSTTPPPLLTESALLTLMHQHGIGTDATMHEHIKKVLERKYAEMRGQMFLPTNLGLGLIEGYDSMGLEMSKPHMRARMEAEMLKICSGQQTKAQVIRSTLDLYLPAFMDACRQRRMLVDAVRKNLYPNGDGGSASGGGGGGHNNGGDDDDNSFPPPPSPPSPIRRPAAPRTSTYPQSSNQPTAAASTATSTATSTASTASTTGFRWQAPTNPTASSSSSSYTPPSHSTNRNTGTSSPFAVSAPPPAPSSAARGSGSAGSAGDVFLCACSQPAVQFTSQSAANPGRQFMRCATRTCGFFVWADSDARLPSFDTLGSRPNTNSRFKKCGCNRDAVLKTVTKADSDNRGRQFWTCDSKKCDYFEWAEEGATASSSAYNSSNNRSRNAGGAGGGGSGGNNCYKCNQPGHFASACPNGASAPSRFSGGNGPSSSSTSSGTKTSKPRACSICRKPGHTKKTCPMNGGGAGGKSDDSGDDY